MSDIVEDFAKFGEPGTDGASLGASSAESKDDFAGNGPEIIEDFDLISDGGKDNGNGAGNTNGIGGTATGRRRGRPLGSRNRNTETGTKVSQNLTSLKLEELLYSLHLMGKSLLSVPELELDRDEAKKLSAAVARVAELHAVEIDPKKVAYFNLFAVAGSIYGPRIMAYRIRSKSEAKQRGPQPVKTAERKQANGAPIEFKIPMDKAPSEVFGDFDNGF